MNYTRGSSFALHYLEYALRFSTSTTVYSSHSVDVMGGLDYDMFAYFKSLLLRGLIAARKHHEEIMTIVEIMSIGKRLFVSETDELIQALTCRASVLQPLQFVHCAIASMSLPQTSSYSNSYVFQHNFILIAKYKLCEFASILWLIFRFLTTFTYQFLKCCW